MRDLSKLPWAMGALVAALLSACSSGGDDAPAAGAPVVPVVADKAAECNSFAPDAFVTRNELETGNRKDNAQLLLRFVQFTDDHIIDDEAQAIIGASITDPILDTFESAQRFQEEYSDEVLNDIIARTNDCTRQFPADFMIVTGDSADLTAVNEIRRFIDNLDGSFDQPSAFEQNCIAALGAGASAATIQQQCTRFTGKGLADTQTVDPDINSPLFQLLPTRTALQLLNTERAAATGRASDGTTSNARSTLLRAPGLPQELRCTAGTSGCINQRFETPWYVAFGNHDGYVRGTVALPDAINVVGEAAGRHLMLNQHEFTDEFFFTSAQPGPVGHGFNFVEPERRADADQRNDGYYALDTGNGKFRLIVMNTIVDGHDPRLPLSLLRNPFALSDGSIDAQQFAWIKRELAAAALRRQLVLVFSHHPDLTFAEFGMAAPLVNIEVTAAELDAELASWPNLIAWIAGHTHLHRVRPFKVENGTGSNGEISAPVACKGPGECRGFWQIETASLIDYPQEQRMLEVFDNQDGTGTIRGPIITHSFERSRVLADADDRCALYLADPAAVAAAISDGGLDAVCSQGRTRQGEATDRNVELMFRMPQF